MFNLVTDAQMAARDLTDAYFASRYPAGDAAFEVANSSGDSEAFFRGALQADRQIQAFVEEHGEEEVREAFEVFVEECVRLDNERDVSATDRLAAAIERAHELETSAPSEEAQRAAKALLEHLSNLEDLDGDELRKAMDVMTHGVNRKNPDYYFNHRFGPRNLLVDSTTIAEGGSVEHFINEIRVGTIDPTDWWDDAWDEDAQEAA